MLGKGLLDKAARISGSPADAAEFSHAEWRVAAMARNSAGNGLALEYRDVPHTGALCRQGRGEPRRASADDRNIGRFTHAPPASVTGEGSRRPSVNCAMRA